MLYNEPKKGIRLGKALGYVAWEMSRDGRSFTF